MLPQRIAILNFAGCGNYGANLTAYALQQQCKAWGHRVEQMNQRHIYSLSYDLSNYNDFCDEYLDWTEPLYGPEHFRALNNRFDSFLVGSDQVWTYQPSWNNLCTHRELYGLDFATAGKRRISVAASFGSADYSHVPEPHRAAMEQSLANFTAISVREASGVDICRDYLHAQAQHVMDPVFLVSQAAWASIGNKGTRELPAHYAAFCALHDSYAPIMAGLADSLSNVGLERVNLRSGTVPDWLRTLMQSDFVIADSFHVVCFAIIFEKNFICLNTEARGGDRLPSLLGMLGLEQRLIPEQLVHKEPKQAIELIQSFASQAINYTALQEQLEERINATRLFLHRALNTALEESHPVSIDEKKIVQEAQEFKVLLLAKIKRLRHRCFYHRIRGIFNKQMSLRANSEHNTVLRLKYQLKKL